MAGKFFLTSAYVIIIIYAQEVFPTNVRNFGLGLFSAAGMVGSIFAPYSVYIVSISRLILENHIFSFKS